MTKKIEKDKLKEDNEKVDIVDNDNNKEDNTMENNQEENSIEENKEEVSQIVDNKVVVMFNVNAKYGENLLRVGDTFKIDNEEALELEKDNLVRILTDGF